ncbi:MAG: WD40 repeat domain-containing protein, partial [Gammaproteobacteria bacterium]|nr:WD40 repeat domain-containing protein [Gammaproteobacteria bacterium]
METGEFEWESPEFEKWEGGLAFSPDGRRLAAGAREGKIVVVDLETGEKLEIEVGQGVGNLAFSPDGTIL